MSEDLSVPEHMIWRPTGHKTGVWYYDRRWPVDVQTAVGEKRHKRSLRTASFDAAKREYLKKEAWFDAAVIAARQNNPTGTEYDTLQRKRVRAYNDARRAPETFAVAVSNDVMWITDKDGRRTPNYGFDDEQGLESTFVYTQELALRDELKKLEAAKVLGVGDLRAVDTQIDAITHVLKGTVPVTEPAKSKLAKLSVVITDYLAYRKTEVELKYLNKQKFALEEFKKVCGDKAIDLYTRQDGISYFEYLEKSVARGTKQLLSRKTKKDRLFHVSSFFAWTMTYRHNTGVNPVEKMKPPRVKSKVVGRTSFDTATLNKMFALLKPDDFLYWPVLIALYAGVREQAVVQLVVEDVFQSDGVWCFRFHDEGDNRQKTGLSFLLPVHKTLLTLGLLAFVRSKKTGRLFPEVCWGERMNPKNGDDKWADRLGRRFNDGLLRQHGLKTPQFVFHSLRHTYTGACRDVEMSSDMRRFIQGRAESGSGGGYDKPRQPKASLMQKYVDQVSYGIEIEKTNATANASQ